MALYVDSAFLDDITNVARTVPIAGVTTNPTLLLTARERGQRLTPEELLKALVEAIGGTIFMQPGSLLEDEMYNESLHYIEIAPQRIIPKIPMIQAGMRCALRLKRAGQRVAFTAVTSTAQAYAAAMAEADFIIPYFNRMERSGIKASERVTQMATLFGTQQFHTRILAASIKSPMEATSALLAGAHDLTVIPPVLLEMVTDPQSEQAVEKFAQDWHKMKVM